MLFAMSCLYVPPLDTQGGSSSTAQCQYPQLTRLKTLVTKLKEKCWDVQICRLATAFSFAPKSDCSHRIRYIQGVRYAKSRPLKPWLFTLPYTVMHGSAQRGAFKGKDTLSHLTSSQTKPKQFSLEHTFTQKTKKKDWKYSQRQTLHFSVQNKISGKTRAVNLNLDTFSFIREEPKHKRKYPFSKILLHKMLSERL